MTKKDETFEKLLDQIRAEKSVSEAFASKKHKTWQKQFKLLYNERKKESMVGDEISWTVSDTIISSLQDDKLLHEFEPTEAGDIEACELLNAMMEYDWNKIRMEEVKDLMCQWTVYVGRCVVDCSEISKRTKTISPRFINPFHEFVDPTALCMHGIGEGADGAARWYGYALTTTRGNLENLETEETEGQQAYKNLSNSKEELKDGENMPVTLLVWYTRFNGACVRILTDIKVTKILQILPVGKEFPLIDASVGVGREWYPRSTLDMLEDKHRTRASVANTAKELVDEKLTPIAIAKTGFPVHLLEQAESGSIIEAENPDGIRFLEKQSVASEATWLLNMLDQQSQEVTGIPEIQQGVQMDEQRTASELSILSSASKRRYGRTAKWFARAFRKFWEIWYDAYQKYWDDEIHQKVVKISGVYGPKWRNIQKKDITLIADVDIRIESKAISDQMKVRKANQLIQFHQVAINDPSYQAKEGIKMIGRSLELSTQDLNFLFPKSTDELEAEEENKLLEQNLLTDGKNTVIFDIHQDHDAHIREHMKGEMTKAMEAHIEMHYQAKIFIKNNPQRMAEMGYMQNSQNQDTRMMAAMNPIEPLEHKTPLGLPEA